MTRIDRATVEKVAALAHLKLSEDEVAYYEGQLGRILDSIEALSSFENPLPTAWRADLSGDATPERVDLAIDSRVIEEVLAAAPRVGGTAFMVPRIIE